MSKESNLERSALCSVILFASDDRLPLKSYSNNNCCIELSVIHSGTCTSRVYIILECDSVEGRCMEMPDKFCVMHLKYLSCVSLHIVESSFVVESPHFKHRRSFGSSRNLPPPINETAFRSRMMEMQPNSLSPVQRTSVFLRRKLQEF